MDPLAFAVGAWMALAAILVAKGTLDTIRDIWR
jgi:hypothetical protein